MSMPLSHFVPVYPSPSPCPQVHSLRLCLYSCPAPRFIRRLFKPQLVNMIKMSGKAVPNLMGGGEL